MKNLHLVPVNIIDIVEKVNDKTLRENEHMNYVLRLETIRDYCSDALSKQKSPFVAKQDRFSRIGRNNV